MANGYDRNVILEVAVVIVLQAVIGVGVAYGTLKVTEERVEVNKEAICEIKDEAKETTQELKLSIGKIDNKTDEIQKILYRIAGKLDLNGDDG